MFMYGVENSEPSFDTRRRQIYLLEQVDGGNAGQEREISKMAGDMGVGPAQYEDSRGESYIKEKFVRGPRLIDMDPIVTGPDEMHDYGRRVGEILSLLHSVDILYNQAILWSPSDSGNLIVPPDSEPLLVSYRNSVLLRNPETLSDDDIFRVARNLEFYMNPMFSGRGVDESHKDYLAQTRGQIIRNLRDMRDVFSIDTLFLTRDMTELKKRFGEEAVKEFMRGFGEVYNNSFAVKGVENTMMA
jgi:hypothetical protein